MKRLRRILMVMALAAALSFCAAACSGESGTSSGTVKSAADSKSGTDTDDVKMEVHFIDVGQGDSTLICSDGHAMLIDAGDNSEGTAIQSYLSSQGISKLDYAIGTHPDSDHIGGLDVIIYKFDCKKVLMPDVETDTRTYDDVIQSLKSKSKKATHPKVGKTYTLGDAEFTIIAPLQDYGDETNNWSIGLLLTCGENRFLFTGDAEKEAEEDILAKGTDISADVYKASHHGSKTGSSEEFLDAANPKYCVISCGEGNKYGHPSAQTLINLRTRGIKVFRTDRQGTIVASCDGENITWNMSPDESWTPGEATGSSTDWTEKKKDTSSGTSSASTKSSKKTTYVINEKTMKFHLSSCRYTKNMEKEHRTESTEKRNKLIKKGYEPCKVCNP